MRSTLRLFVWIAIMLIWVTVLGNLAFATSLARLIHEGAMSGGGRGEIGPKMLVAG
jgi:surface polysaccharide O-acyltransferase-like enzyme